MLVLFAGACGEEREPDCPGVACPTGADTAGSTSGDVTTATATASGTTTATSSTSTTTSSTTAGATTDTATTTGADAGTTSAGTTDPDPGSTTAACEGQSCPALDECFGLGVWQSCAQFCNAGSDSCVEGGCDGATVAYYDDVNACVNRQPSSTAATACDAPFMMGGGVSFGRCCCQ